MTQALKTAATFAVLAGALAWAANIHVTWPERSVWENHPFVTGQIKGRAEQ